LRTDEELIERILSGDTRSFEELVYRHKNKAMTLAVRLLKNYHDAEEALQDAFVRAFHALRDFKKDAKFSTWFYRIVFNVCSTKLAQRGTSEALSLDNDESSSALMAIPSDGLSPGVRFEQADAAQLIQNELDALPQSYRVVSTLFFIQEMSYEEIVSVTGEPLGTVKTKLFRARVMLRNALAKKFQPIETP
jgi:RNA polymerase sigma-70 factor, ECF subfamily